MAQTSQNPNVEQISQMLSLNHLIDQSFQGVNKLFLIIS